jgi:hypothetical protein
MISTNKNKTTLTASDEEVIEEEMETLEVKTEIEENVTIEPKQNSEEVAEQEPNPAVINLDSFENTYEIESEAKSQQVRAACFWNIVPTEVGEDTIIATNTITGEVFEGTITEYNAFMKG